MKPHPQAEILRAIADGEEIEGFYDEKWYGVVPMTALLHIYYDRTPLRIRPKTINDVADVKIDPTSAPAQPVAAEDADDQCPDCGRQLKVSPGGGVGCVCGYWFCY